MNRYGEKAAQRPIGVETVSFERYWPEWNPDLVATRTVQWNVDSERHVWQIARQKANPSSPAALRLELVSITVRKRRDTAYGCHYLS